ncbi:MAG: hypothetical protein H0T42_26170 [Deltaproteobacteria bacterium]|nr:hypothetical protein [Deltaproteobacteria bacterium]
MTLGVGAGSAAAEPSYSQQLDQHTLGKAKIEVGELAAAEGLSTETAELLLQLDVFATSSDTGCPGVDVDVINATGRTVWNVEIVIEQKDGSKKRSDKLHLPYMLTNTKVRANVSCLQDYASRSSYDYGGNTPISLSYSAQGSKSIDEALPLMQAQKRDYSSAGSSVSPLVDGTTTMLEDALRFDDARVTNELVLGIARTGVGREELGAALAASPDGAVADEVARSLKKLSPAQQAQLARTLLASKSAERWADTLSPMIDRQLCKGARSDVIGLWIQAQGETGIPVAMYRDQIRERCKPTKADGPGLVAALEKDPTRAGAVLDVVEQPLFDSALASWKARKDKALIPTSMGAYLRGGQHPDRFNQAAELLPAGGYGVAMGAVAQSPEGSGGEHKAAWLETAMAKVDQADHGTVVASLTDLLVSGSVPVVAMRTTIKGLAKYAPETAEGVIVTFASKSSIPFDATKLQAAGIDMSEFLAFSATNNLGECTTSINTLALCADRIAAYKDKSGPGALQKLARTAVKPDFVTAMKTLVAPLREPAGLIAISEKLSAAGFDVAFVAERACTDAREAARYGGNIDKPLELVAKLAPNAACIQETRDAVSSKKRKIILMSVLAILGLVLPIAGGTWLARRRWRKVQKELPGEVIEEGASGAKLDDRLGARGLGRVLRDGTGEARRELAGTAAGRALESMDDALLAAATTTVARAVKSGDAATLLVRRAGDAVYIVALPVRHPRPQVVQRYLGAPWSDHLAQIQRAAGTPVLALVVMCGPDAAEASLVVGHHDGALASDPEVLLDAKDARDRGANKFRYVTTLAATPAPTSQPVKAA